MSLHGNSRLFPASPALNSLLGVSGALAWGSTGVLVTRSCFRQCAPTGVQGLWRGQRWSTGRCTCSLLGRSRAATAPHFAGFEGFFVPSSHSGNGRLSARTLPGVWKSPSCFLCCFPNHDYMVHVQIDCEVIPLPPKQASTLPECPSVVQGVTTGKWL